MAVTAIAAPDFEPMRPNRVLAAVERYRAELAARPELVAELAEINDLTPTMAWAFSEWTGRAVERDLITDDEADTVLDAIERGTWAESADLALRCAVTQLIDELLKAGVG